MYEKAQSASQSRPTRMLVLPQWQPQSKQLELVAYVESLADGRRTSFGPLSARRGIQ